MAKVSLSNFLKTYSSPYADFGSPSRTIEVIPAENPEPIELPAPEEAPAEDRPVEEPVPA
jgi:hypothetical protein